MSEGTLHRCVEGIVTLLDDELNEMKGGGSNSDSDKMGNGIKVCAEKEPAENQRVTVLVEHPPNSC